jgi:hypothetical protein
MKTSFQERINLCQLAAMDQIKGLKGFKSKIEESLIFDTFFSENKFKGKDSFSELWNCYGLSETNLNWLDVGFQTSTILHRSRFDLMEKWFQILFNGKIAFRPFFDIEIEKHRRIRENANRNELKHLILRVDFDKIAELIDDYFISISNSKLNINTVNGATITPPAKINEELVEAILEFSYTDISNITELKNLIYLITNTDNQTLTDRLNYLNILANSLEKAMSLSNHKLTKAYLNGLYTQIIKWIHETLDIVEWLCNAKYDKLPIDLLKEFKTCKSLHMWKSKNY